jgi:hypothetical protein
MAEAAAVAVTDEGPGRRACPSGSVQGAGARPWPTGLKADGGAVVVWVVVVVDMVNEPRKEASGALEGPVWQGGEEGGTGDSLPRREDEDDDEASRPLSSPDEEKNEDDDEKNDDEEEKNGEEPTSERG